MFRVFVCQGGCVGLLEIDCAINVCVDDHSDHVLENSRPIVFLECSVVCDGFVGIDPCPIGYDVLEGGLLAGWVFKTFGIRRCYC